jgi:hypothetical protein
METHPPAKDRFANILDYAKNLRIDFENWSRFLETVNGFKQIILEDLAVNIETYETYGSMYLDRPNTEWRGPALVDRVDYY